MKTILRKSMTVTFFVLGIQLYAQNAAAAIIPAITGAFSVIERSDWRRYDNGKYIGLVRNEVRASIIPDAANAPSAPRPAGTAAQKAAVHPAGEEHTADCRSNIFTGNYYLLQSTLRDMRHSAQAVDAIIPVHYDVLSCGAFEVENDRGFPMMRGFPAFPNQGVTPGVKWQAPGKRAVDPFNTGQAVVIPFIAEYEYRGIENYNGMPVYRFFAVYGYNFKNETEGHPYARVMGNHRVDILIRVEDGLPVFMRDDLNITYTLANGSKIEFKGFTLTFGSSIVPMNKNEIITSLDDTPVVEDLSSVPEGIKLTIRDILFMPDSAEFLPTEGAKLDQLAQALKKIPDRSFLVEGHTASTGRPENEMQLSIERAKSIINEMVKRGISAERFIYIGWGGTKPIADNGTDSGRSANRRVEITILE